MILFLFLRYFTILLFSFNSLWIFYYILTPLTIHASAFLFKFLFYTTISGNDIILNSIGININNACVAGAAFYLLFMLIFSISLQNKKRINVLLFSFLSLFVLNVLRIFLFGILYVKKFSLFDITHKFFWYFLSSLFVLLIWILTIKLFDIKEIPIYSDFKFLMKKSFFYRICKVKKLNKRR